MYYENNLWQTQATYTFRPLFASETSSGFSNISEFLNWDCPLGCDLSSIIMSSSSGPIGKENKQTNPHRLSKSINNCQDICSSLEIWNRKCLLREEGMFKRTVLLSTRCSLDLWLLFLLFFFFFFNAFRLKAILFLRTSLSGVFRESL